MTTLTLKEANVPPVVGGGAPGLRSGVRSSGSLSESESKYCPTSPGPRTRRLHTAHTRLYCVNQTSIHLA
ncbi:hypothetical protein M8J76_016035 [Diaphorina citri]|nr:hypothetical protein M8J76_016035 [Diaphorina citri]